MKNITINTDHAGLVYKNGVFKKVITAGNYWFWFGETVEVYDQSKTLIAGTELNVLLLDKDFEALVHVIDVKDKEIALVFQDGKFKQVLAPGKYAFWKGLNNYSFQILDISDYQTTHTVDRYILEKSPMAAYVRSCKVENHERGLMIVDGKFEKELPAGTYFWWKNPTNIQLIKADTRQQNMEISGQEILTRDKAQLRINFTMQYMVTDVRKALLDNKDFEKQLYVNIQLELREVVGKLSFDELMENKERISGSVLAASKTAAASLGVELTGCGLKDIILPGDIREIMNQVLVAEKKAQANLITRREETASTRSLLNTAKLMEDNTMLYKLKEMEYVEKITEKINTISLSGNGQLMEQLKQLFLK